MAQSWKGLVAVLAFFGIISSSGTAKQDPLNFFVGHWETVNHYLGGEMGPAGTSNGSEEFHWGVGDRWLVFDSHFEMPGIGPYEVHWLIALDEPSGHYRAFVFNNLGAMAMEYDGAWQDATTLVFTSTSGTHPGNARVVYKKRADGSVRFIAERSLNGTLFEMYFEAVLSRRIC